MAKKAVQIAPNLGGTAKFSDDKQPPRRGSRKGIPNKTTVAVKDAILNAFEVVGGKQYLVMVALNDPKTFCTLLGRVLPLDVSHSGEVKISKVERAIVEASDTDG